MDNLPDHIFVKDTDSRFVVANAATLHTLGAASMEEVVGKTDFDFLPRDRAEQFFASEQHILRSGEPMVNREELLIDASGTARWLATTKVPLHDDSGTIVGLVGISHDISKRRTMESELRRAVGAAEAASKAKGEFLARMSHEIRTPMGGIIGMTELALDSELNRDQRDCLQMVLASAESLLTVINDILDFSKIEAGKLQLETAPFSIRDSLADGVRSLGLRAQQKGLELACHVAPDVPDLLIGDLGRLRQVIVNLVGNAIKFTDSGEIVVHVARAASEQDASAPLLHFEVQDTGIGIATEKHVTIFEPFEQADGSNSRKYQGTGLGLAISSQLVQLMGGRMWLDSEPGRGSRFHFTARFAVVTGQENSQGPLEPPDVHGLRVLVVDDNATHRLILREMLDNWRMCPTVLGSTAEALDELRRAARAGTPYPVALIDAVMPPPDGFALAETMHAEPGLAGGVIIMLTPTARAASGERCRELGIEGSLLKPIKQSELLDTILHVINRVVAPPAPGVVAAPGDEVPKLPPLSILLAEDALVNQRLAVRVLEKAGHRVRVANNGLEALDALRRESFDLVLMDVQMPELGGFETTQAIRQGEGGAGRHLPIIALTAHAMKGDREKCLQSGMDGYVTKPIRARDLFQAIEQVLQTFAPHLLAGRPQGEPASSPPATKEGAPMSEEFDLNEALSRCGGDADLLRELIDMFEVEIPGWMASLEKGIATGNAELTQRTAHTVKGAVGTFASTSGWDAALAVERIAKEGRLAEVGPAWDHMKSVITRLTEALKAFKDG
jgi:two-component system sensor histidine kinase/response regulator